MKIGKKSKAIAFMLSFAMILGFATTIGQKDDWRAYAADAKNAQYSLEGAEYWVYTNSGCTDRAEDSNGNPAKLTTNANGVSAEVELEVGTYYVKEVKASKGYILDPTAYKVEVESDKVKWVNGEPGVKEVPQSTPIKIQKIDKETGKPVALGGATLAGAQFQVVYTDGAQITRTWTITTDEDGVATLESAEGDEVYKNSKGEAVLPIGTATITEIDPPTGYLKNNGTITINVGWDGATATKETTSKVSASGATGGFEFVAGDTPTVKVPDQVKRGDLEFKKTENSSLRPMENIAFVITSITTGESHVIVTDENGYANTANNWNPHTQRTNANDSILDSEGNPILNEEGMINDGSLDDEAGIWFGSDSKGNVASVDDSKGAIPYGEYLVTELPSPENEGKVLLENIKVTIKRDGPVIFGGTWVNDEKDPEYDMYKVRNEDAGDNGKGKYGFQPGDFVTYDVKIPNPNAEGTLTMDVSDAFTEGSEYFSKPVVVKVENAKQNKISEDKNTVNITINAGDVATVTYGALVLPNAPEYLAAAPADSDSKDDKGMDCNIADQKNETDDKDGYTNEAETTNVYYNRDGKMTPLEPKKDPAQTPVKEPKIGTYLADDAARKIVSGNPATLVDTVKYEGLTPGKTYVVEGTLMVKDTVNPLVEDGKEVKARSEEFVPTTPDGEVTVTFSVNLDNVQGKELVAFETAYVVKDEDGNKPKDEEGKEVPEVEVTKHEDPEDPAQTVEVPGYEMYKVRNEKASAKGDKFGFEPGSIVTYDVVIKNTSKKASITMDVSDKFTEKPEYFSLPQVAEVKNATENSRSDDGNKVNITVEAGKIAVVVYETEISLDAKEYLAKAAKDSDHLDKDGNPTNHTTAANKPDNKDGYKNVAKVENPVPFDPENPDPENPNPPLPPSDDEGQTPVKEPEIGTYLADDANRKEIGAKERTVLVDTVAYRGLTPGQKYAVVGDLIVKETGDPVENGEKVRAVGVFTAEKSEGSIDVEFVVNTKGMQGKHLVAFETAYNITGTDLGSNPSAEDVEDQGTPVAEHRNIKDPNQTVYITKKDGPSIHRKTPKTGDYVDPLFVVCMGSIFAASLAAVIIMIRRRRALNK